jgi:pimeloyl-ACP methyl ester carboxylesterase
MTREEPGGTPLRIPSQGVFLDGDLRVPPHASSVVVFAHGSGSSRHSPRNQRVAAILNEHGYATLLMDLLSPVEELVDVRTRELRFDITLLAARLVAALDYLRRHRSTAYLVPYLFGASTGAAAALVAAAQRGELVGGVVSRGGRPDLAGTALAQLSAPVLLVVGSADPVVRRLNETACRKIKAPAELVVVPGASHLFEEPGTMDAVVEATLERLQRWSKLRSTS